MDPDHGPTAVINGCKGGCYGGATFSLDASSEIGLIFGAGLRGLSVHLNVASWSLSNDFDGMKQSGSLDLILFEYGFERFSDNGGLFWSPMEHSFRLLGFQMLTTRLDFELEAFVYFGVGGRIAGSVTTEPDY